MQHIQLSFGNDAGKTFQLSAKKKEELRQRAKRAIREQEAQVTAPVRRWRPPRATFEERHNTTASMLADLTRVRTHIPIPSTPALLCY